MSIAREQIYFALFDQLQALSAAVNPDMSQTATPYLNPKVAAPPFMWADRRYRGLGKLGKNQYPALMMLERGEVYDRELIFGPAKVTLVAHIVVQTVFGEDPNAITATDLNNLFDAIENCIETGPAAQFQSGNNKLGPNPDGSGPLVDVVRVSGREVMYDGSLASRWSEGTMEVEIIATR